MFKRTLFVIVIAALTFALLPTNAVAQEEDVPVYGVRGPYPVGTMELVIADEERPLPVTVWYPALNPDGLVEDITYSQDYPPAGTFEVAGHALLDAAADTAHGPYPLIVYSHGHTFSRLQAPFYMEHLASHGFIVMAPDHVGDIIGTQSQLDAFVYRPGDITRTIDFAETVTASGGTLEGMINTELVAVTGHVFGGWTAMVAAGAQWDFDHFQATCRDNPDTFFAVDICGVRYSETQIAQEAGWETSPDGVWPSMGDPRVDAIIPLVPYAVVLTFGPEGLKGVDVPTMLMAGNVATTMPDGSLFDADPPGLDTAKAYELIGSPDKTLVVFDQAGNWIFLEKLSEFTLMDPSLAWLFSDPVWDMDRAHDLFNHFATAFLLAELYGDEDAAAALSPDAVNFPRITYETTGF